MSDVPNFGEWMTGETFIARPGDGVYPVSDAPILWDFHGTSFDEVNTHLSDDSIGIVTHSYGKELGLCWLTPQTARDLAAHLISLADKLEGKAE